MNDARIQETLTSLENNVNKIVDFIYGDLENPQSGYIHRQEKRLSSIETTITSFVKEREKKERLNSRISYAAIGTAAGAFVKSFWGMFNGG